MMIHWAGPPFFGPMEMLRIGLSLPFSVNDAMHICWAGPPIFGLMEMQCVGLGLPFSVNDATYIWLGLLFSDQWRCNVLGLTSRHQSMMTYWAGPPIFGPMEMICIGPGLPFSVNDATSVGLGLPFSVQWRCSVLGMPFHFQSMMTYIWLGLPFSVQWR
jgi:hypothetical protein